MFHHDSYEDRIFVHETDCDTDIPALRKLIGEDAMSNRQVLILLAMFLTLSLGSYGQITNVTNDTITPIEGAGHDYIKMMSETSALASTLGAT